MTPSQPDTVILDLRSAIDEYERDVKHLTGVLDTDPGAMVSWLACYVTTREWAEDEIQNAVIDAVCDDDDTPPDALEKFSDAAFGLGLSMVRKLEECGIFSRSDGQFHYTYSGLLGRSAVFRRTA
ncbi:hypothetical protein HDG34_003202 [Paraburkholderia sp. HC6.4b]|uniref:hypothetical protein n=1 Tax=unclassified Paraburkholderia TaxID=2615204 RepID=UPI001615A610|nr:MULTISPECIES: hypothetical protein [unclassified Paraburkholderia]MBB5409261.1 hypothetical protein [Paraburkholderia sp. HC6.4b]MBB5450989.1 hypothetical protein [Paraburkholderia sp. Kb1A]